MNQIIYAFLIKYFVNVDMNNYFDSTEYILRAVNRAHIARITLTNTILTIAPSLASSMSISGRYSTIKIDLNDPKSLETFHIITSKLYREFHEAIKAQFIPQQKF